MNTRIQAAMKAQSEALSSLIQYDSSRHKATGFTYHIYDAKHGLYVAGIPYFWSQYSERAFAFASRKDALKFKKSHAKALRGGRIEIQKREVAQ